MCRHTLLALGVCGGLAACSPKPVSHADIQHYTGIALCEEATVKDLTTAQERDTTPGFDYHVALQLPAKCEPSFRQQLAALPASSCSRTADLSRGCSVEDAYPKAGKHTSIAVTSAGSGRYDMRFYS